MGYNEIQVFPVEVKPQHEVLATASPRGDLGPDEHENDLFQVTVLQTRSKPGLCLMGAISHLIRDISLEIEEKQRLII